MPKSCLLQGVSLATIISMKKVTKKEPTLADLKAEIHDVLRATDRLAMTLACMAAAQESVDLRLSRLEKDNKEIKAEIKKTVTREYLDEKVALVRGDLVQLARKGDAKLMRLAGDLYDEGVLPEKDLKTLYEMEPFAVISLKK